MSLRFSSTVLALVPCLVAISAAFASQPRSVRIGGDQAARYERWVEGRGPVGFPVDVLNEAARKRNIHIQWIFCPDGPQKAMRAGKVDLWPLQAVRAAREVGLFPTDPWLENEYA